MLKSDKSIKNLEENDNLLRAYEFKWNPKAKDKVRFSKTFTGAYPEALTNVISQDNVEEFLTKIG